MPITIFKVYFFHMHSKAKNMTTSEIRLLQALNAAAVVLQRSAHSQSQVFNTFRDELARLGFRGGLSLLDESGQRLTIRVTVQPDWMIKALEQLEKLTGYKTQGYSFSANRVAIYREVIHTRQTIFASESSATIREILPEMVRPLASVILQTLGTPPGIYAPLISQDRAIGVLNVVGEGLTEADIPAVEAFAYNIAIALENASLFDALRASEDKFSKAFLTSPDSININRLSDGLFMDTNEGFTKLTGYSSEDVRGKTSLEINIWADANDRARLVKGLREHGEVNNMEAQFRLKDGQFKTGLMSARIIQISNEPCILSITRDISERKQAEQERETLLQELETRNAELERFNYTVSHELKNPIVTMKGFIGSINRDLEGKNYLRAQKDLHRVSSAVDKMYETLSDLLELSRIGFVINPPVVIDTTRLIQDAVDSVSALIRSKNVTVNTASEFPDLYGDRILLREVFENLIDNAVKYMGDQPEPVIEIGVRGSVDEPIFYIKDNGMGIEEKYYGKIFGLFEKLDPTIEGTGIGLALVKRIIETHGGRIWVESEGAGKGSTFFFTITDNGK